MKALFLIPVFSMALGFAKAQQASPVTPSVKKDSAYTHIEIESEFPGGNPAWRQFLASHFKYPDKAVTDGVQGTVMVQFIVNKDGKVDSVQALSGPEMLRDAAVAIIKKSPKWIPATIDGKKVKTYKKQPISYKMDAEPAKR